VRCNSAMYPRRLTDSARHLVIAIEGITAMVLNYIPDRQTRKLG